MSRTAHKLITCILPTGHAKTAMKALRAEFDITAANFHLARGVGKSAPLARRGIGEQTEKEILSVVVGEAQADDVFVFLYHETGISQPHGGLIYMRALAHATPFALPEVEGGDDAEGRRTDA
ncbi:MAG: hypothetical protein Q9M29_03025 [Mariprofundaceae bacterium]|nr:hypothetical protein [Mariprofundaceae bacterium]